MTRPPNPEVIIRRLQKRVSRLEEYRHWIHMYARHALFCPRRKGGECTCGLASLDTRFK